MLSIILKCFIFIERFLNFERSNNEECLLILITRKEVHLLLIDGNQTGVLHPDIADPPPHAAGMAVLSITEIKLIKSCLPCMKLS